MSRKSTTARRWPGGAPAKIAKEGGVSMMETEIEIGIKALKERRGTVTLP